MIAAAAWRPDLVRKEGKILLSVLNFLMLLGWWIFLYAFIVFPHQYVVLNVDLYNVYYDHLYGVENILLFAVLAISALTSSGGWRRLYLNLLVADVVVRYQFPVPRPCRRRQHLLFGKPLRHRSHRDCSLDGRSRSLGAGVGPADRRVQVEPPLKETRSADGDAGDPVSAGAGRVDGSADKSPAPNRLFRVFTVLIAMLLLGAFVFLRQYLQDQALMRLLQDSRRSYESQKRLQDQLVQKEKLASLGTLVAGAAGEINHPLTSIMSYSEQLWAQERLSPEQNTLLRKIVNQAQRTRELVTNLLSFAQQAPGEKALVDLTQLLQPRHADA